MLTFPDIEHDGDAVMTEEGDDGPQHEVLIRCTNGDVEKFSSRVGFWLLICRLK